MNSPNFVDTGPPPEKVTPLALDTRTGQSAGPDDRQSFIAHATPERKSIRAGILRPIRLGGKVRYRLSDIERIEAQPEVSR